METCKRDGSAPAKPNCPCITRGPPSTSLDMLVKYRWDAQFLSSGHYLVAKRMARLSYSVGALAIATSSIASTSAFASLSNSSSTGWKVATGMLAATAATLATLQTFMKYDERATLHKNFGARFIEIRDFADRLLIKLNEVQNLSPSHEVNKIAEVAEQMTTAVTAGPDLPNRDWDRGRQPFLCEPTPGVRRKRWRLGRHLKDPR